MRGSATSRWITAITASIEAGFTSTASAPALRARSTWELARSQTQQNRKLRAARPDGHGKTVVGYASHIVRFLQVVESKKAA